MSDPIRADYDAAAVDPSAQQTLSEAVDRLEAIVTSVTEANKVTDDLVQVALAMFLPTLKLLRYDLRMFEHSNPEQQERITKASEAAGDLAIARAVLAVPVPSDAGGGE